jgi:diguanylate cyclase (GGDEF)-like protein
MNKADVFLEKLFYVNDRGIRHNAVNAAIAVIALIIIFLVSSGLDYPALLALGYACVFYSFMTIGKGGGLAVGAVLIFMNMIALLGSFGKGDPFPYILIILILLLFMFLMTRFIDKIDEKENRQKLRSEELDNETNEYRGKTAKLKSAIDANHGIIKNYRALNSVAQKLTSALERQVVVDIISEGVRQIIGKPSVKFAFLVYHEDSGLFLPAVEDKNPETIIKGAVKIYKKDPFDEWIIANKFTLFLKDINDDFRFKDLKKEFFKFKSMIAIPLIENKKIIGILKFFSEEAHAFDKEDARLLNYLGDLCTTAAQNSILYQKTKDLAIRDGLTGLYLRKFFVERLDEEMRRAKETATALSFLLIDIDHFKDCNDTHGHLFGDKVLRILGEFLKDNMRDVDIIGRYGGEEFAVILPNTAMNGSRFVAERLRENFSKLIINVNENEGIKLTLTVGGIEYEKTIKLMELINKADKALYYSKENGRNKVTFWEDIAV